MYEGEIVISIRPYQGKDINIREPFSDLTEEALGGIKSTDVPLLAAFEKEHVIGSETHERAVRFRKDAVERLAHRLAELVANLRFRCLLKCKPRINPMRGHMD